MGVTKEFRCKAHGPFESDKKNPSCPFGCDPSVIERAFYTPPGLSSARTKSIDRTLESVAKSHGLTDMNNRGGAAVSRMGWREERQNAEFNKFLKDRYGDGWGNVPKGGSLNVATNELKGERAGGGALGALGAYHGRPDNVLSEVSEKGLLQPKPVLVRRDHEKLKVEDARPPG